MIRGHDSKSELFVFDSVVIRMCNAVQKILYVYIMKLFSPENDGIPFTFLFPKTYCFYK